MRASVVLAAVSALVLAGCAVSSSDTVKHLSPALARDGYVSDIVIESVPPDVSPGFRATLASALKTQLGRCAHGDQPLRLNVTIASFARQDPALTILVGDSDRIKGTAQLIDPKTNAVVGDFDITRSRGWGGIAAAIALSDAEQKMAHDFAEEVCKRGFESQS